MWECEYAREQIDYKLFFLRLLKKLWLIPLGIVIGSLVFGGIYSFYHFVIKDGRVYRASTTYYVTYDQTGGEEREFYNYYTWQTYADSDFFIEPVYEALKDKVDRKYVIDNTDATIESDYRFLYTYSKATDKNLALEMEAQMQQRILAMPEENEDIAKIEIVNAAKEETLVDVSLIFVSHAFILGAVVGCLLAIVFAVFLLGYDSAVYIPATLEKRYKVTCLGAPSMKEFAENCKYVLKDMSRVAVVAADEDAGSSLNAGAGSNVNADLGGSANAGAGSGISAEIAKTLEKVAANSSEFKAQFIPCNNPVVCPEEADRLRDTDGVVIAVKAGRRNGKKIERLLEQLGRQDVSVKAFVLYGEDEKLLRAYYK